MKKNIIIYMNIDDVDFDKMPKGTYTFVKNNKGNNVIVIKEDDGTLRFYELRGFDHVSMFRKLDE